MDLANIARMLNRGLADVLGRPLPAGKGPPARGAGGPSYQRIAKAAVTDTRASDMIRRIDAGEISVTAAYRDLGWRRPRDRYAELQSVWKHATPAERTRFVAWLNDQQPDDRRSEYD